MKAWWTGLKQSAKYQTGYLNLCHLLSLLSLHKKNTLWYSVDSHNNQVQYALLCEVIVKRLYLFKTEGNLGVSNLVGPKDLR